MKFKIYNVSAEKIINTIEVYKKCEENEIEFNKKILSDSLNISNETARNAIGAARQLNLLNINYDLYDASNKKKIEIFKNKLLCYKPFRDFIELMNRGYTKIDAINIIKNIYTFNIKNETILWTFKNWGRYAGIFEKLKEKSKVKGDKITTGDNKSTNVTESYHIDNRFCFIIMPLVNDRDLQNCYLNVIKPTVSKFGYYCERVDEQEFNGQITKKIIENIFKARVIIADISKARPNCYYELGVVHTHNKDVIHITNSIEDVHFDIKDYNFIIYSNFEQLERKLYRRIEKTIGFFF